jgi:ATP-dependent DNA helicase RecQ
VQALALAGMEPQQIAAQSGLPIRQVYQKLAQAISTGQLELHHAVDLPPGQLERIQDIFLNDAEEDLPGVRAVAQQLDEPVEEGVLHCIRAALILEISG